MRRRTDTEGLLPVPTPRQPIASSGEINHHFVDRYTIGHAAVGVLMALGRIPPGWAWVVAVGWELAERPLKDRFPAAFPNATQDTLANAVGDVLAMMAAYAVMRMWFPPTPAPLRF